MMKGLAMWEYFLERSKISSNMSWLELYCCRLHSLEHRPQFLGSLLASNVTLLSSCIGHIGSDEVSSNFVVHSEYNSPSILKGKMQCSPCLDRILHDSCEVPLSTKNMRRAESKV